MNKKVYHDPIIDFAVDLPTPPELDRLIRECVEQDLYIRPTTNLVAYYDKVKGLYMERVYCYRVVKKTKQLEYKEVLRKVEGYNIWYTKDLYYANMAGYRVNWGQMKNGYYGELLPLDECWSKCKAESIHPGMRLLNNPLDVIKDDPELKYCGYKELLESDYRIDFIEYLSFYRVYPKVEMLVKIGLPFCVKDCMRLNLNGKSFMQIFGLPYSLKSDIRCYGLNTTKKAYRLGIPTEEYYQFIKEIIPAGLSKYITTKNVRKYMKWAKENQIFKEKNRWHSEKNTRNILYHDYIDMAKELNKNLNDDYWLMPKSIKKAHDKVLNELEQVKNKKAEEEVKELEQDYLKILDKYSQVETQIDGFAFVIPKSFYDFRKESKILKHCVGTTEQYYRRMAQGKSLIVFVRKIPEVDKPLETLELDLSENKVIQCRGEFNNPSEYHDQILNAINYWKDNVLVTV